MKTASNIITFEFDDERDAVAIINILKSKYQEILWNNDTKKAMIKVSTKDKRVLVSKSIDQIPKPFRV